MFIHLPLRATLALLGLGLVLSACGPNISSSELNSTTAEELKITANVRENNATANASVFALMETIPDEVGVEFNQGETFKITTRDGDETNLDSDTLSYNGSVFDIMESYTASVKKPDIGDDYILTYTDKDGVSTSAVFYSEGVPTLITPVDDQKIPLKSKFTVTWEPQGLDRVTVKVWFHIDEDNSTSFEDSTSDDGSYTVDLSNSNFDDAVAGKGQVVLEHLTSFDDSDIHGFGDVGISVVSESAVEVIFQ